MRLVGLFAGVLTVMVLASSAVSAQSLGELARREAERRKAITTPGKVFTNESLRGVPLPSPPIPPPAAQASPETAQAPDESAPPPTEPPALPEDDPTQAAYWQTRMSAARDALSRAEVFADALQSRINALTTDFVNRDDPAQRAVIAADRDRALAELDRVREEIAQHQKAIVDLQEQARRAGVPAGWVR